MLERTLQRSIRHYLEAQGFFVTKIHGGPRQMAGLPDLLAILDGRAYWFEVKQPGQHATPLQEYVLDKLRAKGCVAAVVCSVADVELILRLAPTCN